MRGSASAGMCVALEAAGLVPAFDRIYGCSAGALNGAFTAAGRAWLGATIYESASRRFINPQQLARGRPIVDLELVFDELLARKRPLCGAGLGPGRNSARWRCRRAVANCECSLTWGTQTRSSRPFARAARCRC